MGTLLMGLEDNVSFAVASKTRITKQTQSSLKTAMWIGLGFRLNQKIHPMSGRRASNFTMNLRSRCGFQQLSLVLVVEILLRLSIKTLLKCRCVCKTWYRMISDQDFAQLHLSKVPIAILTKLKTRNECDSEGIQERPLPSRIFDFIQIEEFDGSHFLEKTRFTTKNKLPRVSEGMEIDMVNSCNGLLLLSASDSDSASEVLYVRNPIFGEYITIRPPKCWSLALPEFVGIGLSIVTNEYKVLLTTTKDDDFEAAVYTIGTGVWRCIGTPPSHRHRHYHLSHPFYASLHGCLHWPSFMEDVENNRTIHSFNFEKEQFQTLPLPSSISWGAGHYLGVLDGCLLLCMSSRRGGDDHRGIGIWVMKDYGVQETWTKLYEFTTTGFRFYEPLVFLRNEDILLLVFLVDSNSILCYNHKMKEIKETTDFPGLLHAIGYYPSWISLYNVAKGGKVLVSYSKIDIHAFSCLSMCGFVQFSLVSYEFPRRVKTLVLSLMLVSMFVHMICTVRGNKKSRKAGFTLQCRKRRKGGKVGKR